jgi:D-3-phosphoglycerate dehydrogenase/C-terminal binding protein
MMAPFRVVITDFLHDDLAPEREILQACAEVVALSATSESQLQGQIEDADAIILYHEIGISGATIDRLEKCRLIVRGGVGFDNVDLIRARQRGIPVANVPDYGSEEVADSALAMSLSLARGVHLLNGMMQAGASPWVPQQAAPLTRLRGSVFGIVGLGRIGSAAALRAKALGMSVEFYDPYKPDGYDKALGICRRESLADLLAHSLVVSLHCPLTEETRHMIRDATIAQMRPGSYLVNTARGEVVDTDAIPAAIESGQLAGAGIDVLHSEPPPEDDPLIRAWRDPGHPAHHRVIITPHAAFYSEAGMLDIRCKTAEACRRALSGASVRNVVN